MYLDYYLSLSRSDWEHLIGQLCFPDDDRSMLATDYLSLLDTEIQERDTSTGVKISSSQLNVSGIRLALRRRQEERDCHKNSLKFAFECEYSILRDSQQEYVRSESLGNYEKSSTNILIRARKGSFANLEDSFPAVA